MERTEGEDLKIRVQKICSRNSIVNGKTTPPKYAVAGGASVSREMCVCVCVCVCVFINNNTFVC